MQTTILMAELAGTDFIYGSNAGALVLEKMQSLKVPEGSVMEVDFSGMRAVDACFIRDSLAAFMKMNCGSIGLFVSNVPNVDIVENAAIGFQAKGLPMIMKSADGAGAVIADYPSAFLDLVRLVYAKNEITTQLLVRELDVSAPNASAKLKKMFTQGLLLATKRKAETGGVEYVYRPCFVADEIRAYSS